jgi:UDP-N-acetyl-2-amino-2-deoxyglucuronate dehydrogenase
MKFALIGTGFIMPRHVEAINHIKGKIVDVVNTAHGEHVWRDMIASTTADYIVILTPNHLHYEMAEHARKHGKMVLSEKPLTLSTKETKKLARIGNVFTVMQLRHHPTIVDLKSRIDPKVKHAIVMDIAVYRDADYDKGWKGQVKKSGGILFNLGVHYFDIIQYLFGMPTQFRGTTIGKKTAAGICTGKNYECSWRLSTDETRERQRRIFEIDGIQYNLSSQDNLSYENLHRAIYRDIVEGRGITAKDALPSIEFIERIMKP